MRPWTIRALRAGLVAAVLLAAGPGLSLDLGPHRIVNTGGFVAGADGTVVPLPQDLGTADLTLHLSDDATVLTLDIAGTRVALFRRPDGLASIDWTPRAGVVIHRDDLLALAGKTRLEEVDTWGAEIDWPASGPATLVLFDVANAAYAGFLVSRPGGKTVVRQMELHRHIGPRRRISADPPSRPSGD